MKVKQIVIGLLVASAVVLVPTLSISKEKANSDSVTLSNSNTLILNSEVNGDSTSSLIAKARSMDGSLKKGLPLYLFLNTPGGSIQSGLELIEALHGLGRPVQTITLFSASMGFQIAQNLNDRLILKNGVLMSHHAAGGVEGSFGGVHPSQMDSRYQLWIDRVRELDEQTVKRTNGKQTYESYTAQYDHEMWLTGSKSVDQGYADRIVTVRCDSTLNGVTTKTATILIFTITYDLDNCPINTSPMNIRVGGQDGKIIAAEVAKEIGAKFSRQFDLDYKQKQVVQMY